MKLKEFYRALNGRLGNWWQAGKVDGKPICHNHFADGGKLVKVVAK